MKKITPILLALSATLMLALSWPVRAESPRKAEKEIKAGNYLRAEEIYRELVDKDPKNLNARLGLSFALLKKRNLQGAYDESVKVLEIDRQNARAFALVGTALLRSGYFTRAADFIRAALHFNAQEPLALATSAEMDLAENRTSDAFAKLRLAISVDRDEPDYWLVFARASSRLERFKDAAEALKQFLRYAPKGDTERRARIEGVIQFYSYLGNTQVYILSGEKSVAMPLKIAGRRPYLQVKLNGQGPFNFIVDTGSGVTVLSQDTARRLGVREVARGGNANAVGGEGSFPIVYGLLNDLELGGIKISTVPVYIREIHAVPGNSPENLANGYLGLSVLSNFLITLDYRSPELRLEVPPEDLPAIDLPIASDETTVVPFRTTEAGLISVEGKLEDQVSMNFILDSGASSTVISTSVVEQHNLEKNIVPRETVRIVGAAGITNDVKVLRGKLQVVDLLKENLRMPILNLARLNEFSGFELQGILGGDFLNCCQIQIDFRRLQVKFTPFAESNLKRKQTPAPKEGQ